MKHKFCPPCTETGTPFYSPAQVSPDESSMRVMPAPTYSLHMPAACTFIRNLHHTDDVFSL